MPSGTAKFPYATSPDIIRSYQKDQYFQNKLYDQITTVSRNVKGVRATHLHSAELRQIADAMYLSLTTMLGNRTLGEEYCDILQVEAPNIRLPSLLRRSAYVLATILVPYAFSKWLPNSSRLRGISILGRHVENSPQDTKPTSRFGRFLTWLSSSDGLISAFSTVNIYALNLAVFYFSGSYYHISKRLLRLRYVFAKRVAQTEQRVGYELLGVFLTLQLSVQMWLHIQSMLRDHKAGGESGPSVLAASPSPPVFFDGRIETETMVSNTSTVFGRTHFADVRIKNVGDPTVTTVTEVNHVELSNPRTMSWIGGRQQRNCTLCLDELRNPSITSCGHVFCWTCIGDWIKEKEECPLCRSNILLQHVLVLRN